MNGRIRLAMLAALATLASTSGIAGALRSHHSRNARLRPSRPHHHHGRRMRRHRVRHRHHCRGTHLRPSRSNLAAVTDATLCVVNGVRRSHHLKPFRMNAALRSIASGQSNAMLIGGYFGDDGLSGRTPLQRVAASSYGRHSRRLSVSQNIAWGQAGQSTPIAIVRAWMASPPHRRILLAPGYRDVGIGVSLGTPRRSSRLRGATYTLDLATRAR
jgi:uncharacterized protein YkwD